MEAVDIAARTTEQWKGSVIYVYIRFHKWLSMVHRSGFFLRKYTEKNKSQLFLEIQSNPSSCQADSMYTISAVSLNGAVSNRIFPGELDNRNPKSI